MKSVTSWLKSGKIIPFWLPLDKILKWNSRLLVTFPSCLPACGFQTTLGSLQNHKANSLECISQYLYPLVVLLLWLYSEWYITGSNGSGKKKSFPTLTVYFSILYTVYSITLSVNFECLRDFKESPEKSKLIY